MKKTFHEIFSMSRKRLEAFLSDISKINGETILYINGSRYRHYE